MGTMINWDTHNNNFTQLKYRLLPPLDLGVSAWLDGLDSSGLLDQTLVVMVGEFGRTPKNGENVGTPSDVHGVAIIGRGCSLPCLPGRG